MLHNSNNNYCDENNNAVERLNNIITNHDNSPDINQCDLNNYGGYAYDDDFRNTGSRHGGACTNNTVTHFDFCFVFGFSI